MFLNTIGGAIPHPGFVSKFKYCPECGKNLTLRVPGGDKIKYKIDDTILLRGI
jgi:hypothetical protein